ncbi:MAG: Kelch repeat-containing protein [Actinomycetota bacterium]
MRRTRLFAGFCTLAVLAGACSPATDEREPEPPSEARQSGDQELRWRRRAAAPLARTENIALRRGRRIYIVGGFVPPDGATTRKVHVYNVRRNSWRRGRRLPIAVNHAMGATLGGEVYVFGGYLGPGVSNPTDRGFVLRDGRWRSLPAMPEARAAGGVVKVGGKLYVVGGVGPDGLGGDTFVFDPDTRQWTTAPGLSMPREHLGVAAAGGKIYAVAGRTGGFASNTDAVESFDPATGLWSEENPLPTARGGLAATATRNGFVVAVGGEGNEGTFEEAEAFDVTTGEWRALPPLPTPRHGLGVAARRSRVFVIAGGPEPGLTFSDVNEAINLSGLR